MSVSPRQADASTGRQPADAVVLAPRGSSWSGIETVDKLFNEIKMVVLRSLIAVQPVRKPHE